MRAKAVAVLTFLLFSISIGYAANQKVLYTFTGSIDGGEPYAGVIFDAAGNLYGVTESGGLYGNGTVFQLRPFKASPGGWIETVLYNFTGGADGRDPIGGLAIDEAGNLYGTTAGGTSSYCGALFKLEQSGIGWTFKVLHNFTGIDADGCYPGSNLTYFNGALFGTTVSGGSRDQGTIFSLSTSGEDYNAQSFSRNNGRDPWGGFNSWGYGTTFRGGKLRRGNVYELACCGRIYVKHTFNLTSKAGIYPMGDLITQNADGALRMYGTTFLGGDGGQGTVYQLRARETKYGAWAISVLHSFSGSDGANPSAGVVLDSAGNLYGTTTWGGTEAGYAGTVFKLTPGPKNQWTHTVLYSFTGGIDGDAVYSGVVLDNAGNLYGTTFLGGAFNKGVVYEVTP